MSIHMTQNLKFSVNNSFNNFEFSTLLLHNLHLFNCSFVKHCFDMEILLDFTFLLFSIFEMCVYFL